MAACISQCQQGSVDVNVAYPFFTEAISNRVEVSIVHRSSSTSELGQCLHLRFLVKVQVNSRERTFQC